MVIAFATYATDVVMPPGYEQALIKNLAVDVAPSFDVTPSPLTIKSAQNSLKIIERTNRVIPTMSIDSALFGYRGGSLPAFLGGY